MKKVFYLIGAFVTMAAVFATIAVMLKKLKISFSIEGIDDTIDEETNDNIDVSIKEDNIDFNETEDAIEEALEEMLSEEECKEIEVEIAEA